MADASEPPLSYWDEGRPRPFISATAAVGAVSQLNLAAGFGKPHWMWGGVEPSALSTFDFGAVAVGPRLAFLVADLSLKRRWTRAYAHAFLPRQSRYDAADVEDGAGAAAIYGAWDLSLWGLIPTPGGYGLYELSGVWVDGVPADRDLFEEYQRVVVRGDQVLVGRLGWSAWTGAWGTLRLRYAWASGEPRPRFP